MEDSELRLVKARAGESDNLISILGDALHIDRIADFVEIAGVENFREMRLSGQVVAGFGYIHMGQWFGGARVPCTGITAVGVSPEHRGSGVGTAMLRLMLQELHDDGVPLSALYPATTPFYQRVGYQRAGKRLNYELPLDAIDVREHNLTMVPAEQDDYQTIFDLYERRARLSSGHLDRPEWLWWRKLDSPEYRTFRYLVIQDGSPQGYIVYRQGDHRAPITIIDVCVLTPEAAKRVLTFLREHRSIVEFATWYGGPFDPLVYMLREPMVGVARSRAKLVHSEDWMLRLMDVPKALTLRGYPPGLNAELHLDVRDDILPANNGSFVLAVENGKGVVRTGGQSRITLHVRDLAALYSGFMAPSELCATGSLTASDADLALAASVFAGPRPWLPDMF